MHIHKAFIIDEMYANLYGFPFLLCEFIIICVAIIQVTNSTEFLPKNEKEQNDDGNYNSSKSLCLCVFGVWKKEREEFVRPLGNRRRAVSNAKRKNGI